MSALFVLAATALMAFMAALAFRRRTAWFLLERWRQASDDVALNRASSLETLGSDAWARAPERVRGQKASRVVGAFVGSLILAVAGAAALYGEVAQAVGTACLFTSCEGGWKLNVGLALGLGVVASVVFWSMVTTELAGFTNFSGWIRPDHPEVEGTPSRYQTVSRAVGQWVFPVVAVVTLALSIWILAELALVRDQKLIAADQVEMGMDPVAAFGSSQGVSARFWVVQAVTMSLTAAFGALAVKDFLTLLLGTLIFGLGVLVIRVLRGLIELAGWLVTTTLTLGQDLIHLVDPSVEERLTEPYDVLAFDQEFGHAMGDGLEDEEEEDEVEGAEEGEEGGEDIDPEAEDDARIDIPDIGGPRPGPFDRIIRVN